MVNFVHCSLVIMNLTKGWLQSAGCFCVNAVALHGGKMLLVQQLQCVAEVVFTQVPFQLAITELGSWQNMPSNSMSQVRSHIRITCPPAVAG